jgi:hypothetical protein
MHRLIDQYPLRRGAHPTRDDGMCAMEMVAWLAGEPHGDEPGCTCPVLAAFVRACNDALGDAARTRLLRPLVPLLVNTRSSARRETERGLLVVDMLVRQLVPSWLRRHRRHDEARLLAQLPPVRDVPTLAAAKEALERHAAGQHAARWVVQRALDGLAPARYVPGAVQVARALGCPETWAVVTATIVQMAQGDVAASPAAAD